MNRYSPTEVKIGVTGWTRGAPERRTVARYAGAAVNLPAPNRASSGSRLANSPQAIVSGDPVVDTRRLLGLLDHLVESGKSVIVIEHHQGVMAHADWIIDLGPGAGHDGGKVVFEGTPAELIAARSTLTGRHLAGYVGT